METPDHNPQPRRPRIVVNAPAGTPGEAPFGAALPRILPAIMPDVSFFLPAAIAGELAGLENVRGIGASQAVDAALHLAFTPGENPPADAGNGVVFIGDIDNKLFPGPWWSTLIHKKDPLAAVMAKSAALLVPHAHLRQLLMEAYGVSPTKVHVVGHGLPPAGAQIRPADSVTRRITREVYGQEHSYFLTKATGRPGDNLERLLAAYDLFRQRCPERVRLLVETGGKKPPRTVRKARDRAAYRADIVFLPALSPEERRKVVSSARALVEVSLSSAFPQTVLDAWLAEVPVVSTDNHILQGAGTLVPAEDSRAMAEGLVSLVTTPFLASGLVENGKRRREDFSWEQVAERTAAVLRGVLA